MDAVDKEIKVGDVCWFIEHSVYGNPNAPVNEPKTYEFLITEIKDTDNKKDPHSNSEVTNLTPVTCKKLPMKCNIKKMYTFKSKHLF